MSEIHEPELEKLQNLKTSLEETLGDVDAQINNLQHKTLVEDLCNQFKKGYILKVTEEDDDPRVWGLRLLARESAEEVDSLDARLSAILNQKNEANEANEAHEVWRHPTESFESADYPYDNMSTDRGPLGAVTVWTTFEGIKTLIEQCSFKEIESNNKETLAELKTEIEDLKTEIEDLANQIETLKKEDKELKSLSNAVCAVWYEKSHS